jgi:hypothetical protein
METTVRTKNVKIRGHHLLCLNFYRGAGYSPEFVRNVTDILRKIKNRNIKMEIVIGCDDICSACPHIRGGRCEKYEGAEEVVTRMDSDIIKRLGLSIGSQVNFNEVSEMTKKEIKPSDIEEICEDCEWLETCIRIMRKEWGKC